MPEQTSRTRVLVLMGGPDAEHDVSLASGTAVAEALAANRRFEVDSCVIDHISGHEIVRRRPQVVFPALHGPWGEGGPLQEILELVERSHGVGFVGCGSKAAALAMDKWRTKTHLRECGRIQSPAEALFDPAAEPCPLEAPVVLKPISDGSSVDVHICRSRESLDQATAELRLRSRGRIMAERYIAGRELTVGVLFSEALPVIEIVPAAGFYDYQAKYEREDTRYLIDADLPGPIASACREAAVRAYEVLECRDLARVDFMLDDAGPWLLEVNTMPGFTSHSLLPMAAAHVGLDMTALCSRLVDAALERTSGALRKTPSEALV